MVYKYNRQIPDIKQKVNRIMALGMDKGYDFDEIRGIVKEFGFTAHIRSRGEEVKDVKRSARKKARR